MEALSTRTRILEAIRERPSATLRQLAPMVGVRSPATVQHHLRGLENDGRIAREFCECCGSEIWEAP